MMAKWLIQAVKRLAGRVVRTPPLYDCTEKALRLWLVICLLFTSLPGEVVWAQGDDPQARAEVLLRSLTPEERVGQLFLVTFKGTDVGATSQIYDLIVNRHVGGVLLQANRDNFIGPDNTVPALYQMIGALQTHEWDASQAGSGQGDAPSYVPLLVGMTQEGDQPGGGQILSGMTPLPSQMAIGATWKPELAERVGVALGSELQAMGVNLLLGPSLDVQDVVQIGQGEDLGTQTFGGDPFWVGEMGKAYINGLHLGSNNHLAVIAGHFPGRGGSDRPPEDEVATVRKSLEQLKQIELAPFFAVTGNAGSTVKMADGLLVSHIRYQGFQGNIRATTRPVSFDPAALGLILGLQPLAMWREGGGLVVSDNLGSAAVRRFYDPTGRSFDARQVARNALLAGNDLLYVDNFVASGDPDAYTTLTKTLDFFVQKYREDPAFAQRVDASVTRILMLKYRLYPAFRLEAVLPPEASVSNVGKNQQAAFDVASRAVTLISPDANELSSTLPRPPEQRERILFITDQFAARQCSQCAEQPLLGIDALQNVIVRLYGPTAGGQVYQSRMASYSFGDLEGFLRGVPAPAATQEQSTFENDLRSADWVVFMMRDVRTTRSTSLAVRQFLKERPDLLRNKRLIAFALNAPYYLDATDISKLTAYYGLYDRSPAFLEVAARVLFQEATPEGALPVSVAGVGYDLIVATSPEPNQVIPLAVDQPETTAQGGGTLIPTAVPTFRVGDTLPLRTGVIYDHNRNLVPDGTVVRFLFTTGGKEGGTVQYETETRAGVGRASYRIQNPGLLEIRVVSDPAMVSQVLQLDVQRDEAVAVTAIAPTAVIATATPEPSSTPVLATPVPQVTPKPPEPAGPQAFDWLLAALVMAAGVAVLLWGAGRWTAPRWGVRWALSAWTGGALAYLYLALGLPGSAAVIAKLGASGGAALVSLFGMLVGWGCGLLWQRVMQQRAVR